MLINILSKIKRGKFMFTSKEKEQKLLQLKGMQSHGGRPFLIALTEEELSDKFNAVMGPRIEIFFGQLESPDEKYHIVFQGKELIVDDELTVAQVLEAYGITSNKAIYIYTPEEFKAILPKLLQEKNLVDDSVSTSVQNTYKHRFNCPPSQESAREPQSSSPLRITPSK